MLMQIYYALIYPYLSYSVSDSGFLAAILIFELGGVQLELSCCRTLHPYVEFLCLA